MFEALPDTMPRINAAPPHWLYWLALIGFPLIAMILARRRRGAREYKSTLGYFILVLGGFIGLHRFYLKNLWGFVFLPLFALIIYGNSLHSAARSELTDARAQVVASERVLTRMTPKITESEEKIARYEAALIEDPESPILPRRITSERRKLNRRMANVAEAEETVTKYRPQMEAAEARQHRGGQTAALAFSVIALLMILDAVLMPLLVRSANQRSTPEGDPPTGVEANTDHEQISQDWTRPLDAMAFYAGEFAAYWAVIAVLVYFFEVVSRYVFNSPTIWAHEGMYLMFGMQYMLCGAYAMMTDSHVRVDIFYASFSPRWKAISDILTSVFFFLFAGVLLVTGWTFAMDATEVREVSTETWRIARWPFKWAIVIGAVLLLAQGVSKLAKDIHILRHGAPPDSGPDASGAALREAA